MNEKPDEDRGRRTEAGKPDAEESAKKPEKPDGPPEEANAGGKRAAPPGRPPLWKNPLVAGAFILVVILAAVGGTLFWLHSRKFEKTDDAYVDAAPQQVSAQIAGRITRVLVNDNQDVAAGDELVELDPADFRSKAAGAEAGAAEARARLAQARAEQTTQGAQRGQAQASEAVAEAAADKAGADLRRYRSLHDANPAAVSAEQLDEASAAQRSAAARLQAARQAVAAADAQTAAAASLVQAAEAAVASAGAQVRQANLNLGYAILTASLAGRIANKQVAPGDYVQPGAPLMAVVPAQVYVTANFKETQLAHMRRGQPAKITVDAYPDLEIRGRVDSVQAATGQSFSALPAETADSP